MDKKIQELIRKSLQEDIGRRDVTSEFLFKEDFTARAILTAKEDGIICGIDVFKGVFLQLSSRFRFRFRFKDGDRVSRKDLIAEMTGPVREMMAGERTALNFIQRLSGIATLTRQFVRKAGKVEVYDTRKTTPLLRKLEKYAVRTGGGMNHRIGLYDMVLIKDNHISAYMQRMNISPYLNSPPRRLEEKGVGENITDRQEAIYRTVERAVEKAKGRYKVEVEVESFTEAKEGFLAGADIIMFDNADAVEVRKFIKFLGSKRKGVVIEWSGNVDLKTIGNIKKLPVDRVSVGALTHSARALDFSLKIKEANQLMRDNKRRT